MARPADHVRLSCPIRHTMDDIDRVRDYAQDQPDFGGTYRQDDQLVVLFTTDVGHHEAVLSTLVDDPDRLTVRTATRSWSDIQAANNRIKHILLSPAGIEGVVSVGVIVSGGQFAIEVGIDPYDDARCRAVQRAVRPDPVVVRERPRPRLPPL